MAMDGKAGKKCRLVDNIGARLGSEANFGSHKVRSSSSEINCIGKIWLKGNVYMNSKKRTRKDTGAVSTTNPARWRSGSKG